MGRRAVETVLALVRGEPVPPVVTVPTELVVRRSCGCRPAASPYLAGGAEADGNAVVALRRALRLRPDRLPPDWPRRLAALFDGAVRGDPPGEFLHRLEDLAQASLSGGESVESWWRVLYALRQLATRVTTDAAETARIGTPWPRRHAGADGPARWSVHCGQFAQRYDGPARPAGHPAARGVADRSYRRSTGSGRSPPLPLPLVARRGQVGAGGLAMRSQTSMPPAPSYPMVPAMRRR
jgi:hypothetical protein